MVLSLEEEKELQKLKQDNKLELLKTQHEYTMKELSKQLQIEAVKSYNESIDYKVKTSLAKLVFGKDGEENGDNGSR